MRARPGASRAVVVEVADEGDGVPDDLAPRIFEREVTSGKGTGLGLSLARDLASADGARLELAQRRPAVFALFLAGVPAAMAPDVVHQQEEEWRPTFEAEGRRLVIEVDPKAQVLATPGALAQVLATLIENSLRHGGGTTTVRSRPGASRASPTHRG